MAELFFLSFAAYMVWYAIKHLRAEHRENGGFLTHPYGHPANGETATEPTSERPRPSQQRSGSLDDQPAHVIAEVARKAFNQ